MSLLTLKNALAATGLPFAHYAWANDAYERRVDHGVYAEDGANDLYADGIHSEKVIQGTVDYYTRDDSGAPQTTIEAALNTGEIAWYLNSIQFEEDTGFIHYEWIFEV